MPNTSITRDTRPRGIEEGSETGASGGCPAHTPGQRPSDCGPLKSGGRLLPAGGVMPMARCMAGEPGG
eukprot:361413-Chlamydomonas_euryale.AAC.3